MLNKPERWTPPEDWLRVRTIDLHTAGEPLRVITSGLPEIPGDTILDKRRYFKEHYDAIRTGLMWEPRGHADMYGALITPPVTDDGHFGTFFLHNEGYSTMCGHAMIALATLTLDTGMVDPKAATEGIRIDAPPGRVTAFGQIKDNRTVKAWFRNVPSFVLYSDQEVMVPGIGKIRFDVAYGGAFYAFVDADEVGLRLEPDDLDRLISYGKRIKQAVATAFPIVHPFEEDLSFLYGTIFTGKPFDPSHHSRNVCVFADGEVDRSPTGSGVSARAAIHYLRKDLDPGYPIIIESILGTLMEVEIMEVTQFGNYTAVIPQVSGSAHFTGRSEFFFDPQDSLRKGFIMR